MPCRDPRRFRKTLPIPQRLCFLRASACISSLASILVLHGCADPSPDPVPGVALELAEHRAGSISDLRYDVHFDLPEHRNEPVRGEVTVRFGLDDARHPLVLDFRAAPDQVHDVQLNGEPVTYTLPADHIVIPARALRRGPQEVTVRFTSGDDALNRHDDFLYALFVPDRASTAFPVFEQPDLKARLTLSLTIPAAWQAIGNGALTTRDSTDAARHLVRFAETEPLSTYLFSFAAGRLFEERAVREGRELTMYHRETDSAKVTRNRDAIFDLHARSLRWLEEYTGIPYPFGKFAFFAIPAFQFGGMEHPGAIWYRAESLFLDPTASRNQELGRASLIAHETAHMWFGDLVTMRWFNDVWMKEVFANFMAAKIAGPAFPDINLGLRFFQAHHPAAYAVDRTTGTNPIRQELGNLREAGSLYGAIIYQKAPVVMRQLEELVGEATLRDGLRTYLSRHRFGNATWPDLIRILDDLSPEDLALWSRSWVEEPGRPRILVRRTEASIEVTQEDPVPGRNLRWTQPIAVALVGPDRVTTLRIPMREATTVAALPAGPAPEFLLPGADGIGYGRFAMDSAGIRRLLGRITTLPDPIHRAVGWQALWEEMLDGALPPADLLDATLAALAAESDELIALQVIGLLRNVYWRFLDPAQRLARAPEVERAHWRALEAAGTPGRKGALFSALVGVTLTTDGLARLERIWRKAEQPRGLPLAETQYTALAEALAVRGHPDAAMILDTEAGRIANPDRRARFEFIRPALNPDPVVRDSLFRSLALVENRRRESWVLDAITLMNHPLRAESALTNLGASLALVEEIQQTGDIFFPLRWLNATLDGHQSTAAADTVAAFLARHPDYPPRLRGKMLQAADELFRAARIVHGWNGEAPR